MVLADTSVWIEHFRHGNGRLQDHLLAGTALCHPFVIGELALGNLKAELVLLPLLGALPKAPRVADAEALQFVFRHRLAGAGVGWVDVHLLCSAALVHCQLWTLDRRLANVATRLQLAAT